MNFLPNLFTGIQRTGNTNRSNHNHAVKVAELQIYGNYGGPGHGDGTGCTPAKDRVDAVFCRHDVCYHEHGYFNCGCDRDLVRDMPNAIANTSSWAGKAAGAAAVAFFATKPCVP